MAIERIATPDGDRLRNTRTGKLVGRPPRKPRIPKTDTIATKGKVDAVPAEEPSPVEKSFEKFNEVKPVETKYEDNFDFVLHEANTGEHILDAIPKGSTHGDENEAGWIQWHGRNDGRIAHIEVASEHRRKGLATALYNRASQISMEIGLKPPRHHEVRTREGDAWAQSVGGAIPPIHCEACGEPGHYGSDHPF